MASITGGDKLAARLREIAERLKTGTEVRAGFLEGATYPDGTPVATVAAVQEWGAPSKGIPPRPFFRKVIKGEDAKTWGPTLNALLKQTDMDAARALDTLGQVIVGQIKQSIKDTRSPPNAPSTIARKGFNKPLIDTAVMLNSVDHEVK